MCVDFRKCPLCRVQSDFVTPSQLWVETKEEKTNLIQGYKIALKSVSVDEVELKLCEDEVELCLHVDGTELKMCVNGIELNMCGDRCSIIKYIYV